jgi:hypothetical protein
MITNPAAFVQSPQRKAAFAFYLALCTVLSASAQEPTFTTFDPPGSTGTVPRSINPSGEITGIYSDARFNQHGFLRAADGTFTTFDLPGQIDWYVTGINPKGVVTGYYFDLQQASKRETVVKRKVRNGD